jgi:hypothetical protein
MTYEPSKGAMIGEAARLAIEEAINYDQAINLVFNQLEIRVFPESCVNDIVEKYFLQNKIRRLKLGYKD